MQLVPCAAPAPTPAELPEARSPSKLQLIHCTGDADVLAGCPPDRRFFVVVTERRAANDGHAPASSATLNLLVRRALVQSPRRFTGAPITGFGELA